MRTDEMGRSYDVYFSSGLYRSRYLRPNRRTLALLSRLLPEGGRLLDYGAGEGRYCLPLAAGRRADVLAADISAVARRHLAATAAEVGLAGRIRVCDPADAVYAAEVGAGRFDVALLGFGVLGHVAGRARRIALLAEMRGMLAPGGRLVLGLPNAARRFARERRDSRPLVASGALEPGDIRYERSVDGTVIPLFYHLFSAAEIHADLAEAGFAVEALTIESVLPEKAVTRSALIGALDGVASALLPPALGYGFLVTAAPAT